MTTQHTAPSFIQSFLGSSVAPQSQDQVIAKEQFIKFRDAYKELAHNKQLTSRDILLYNVVRGLPPTRGFTPITNKIKLANGYAPNHGIHDAIGTVRFNLRNNPTKTSARFGDFLDITTYTLESGDLFDGDSALLAIKKIVDDAKIPY